MSKFMIVPCVFLMLGIHMPMGDAQIIQQRAGAPINLPVYLRISGEVQHLYCRSCKNVDRKTLL